MELLQEVWLGNDELVGMYEKRLGDAGYMCFKLARTNNRGDGRIYFYLFPPNFDSMSYRLWNSFLELCELMLDIFTKAWASKLIFYFRISKKSKIGFVKGICK